MCLETMDTRSKHIKPVCLRKTVKPGSKSRWRLLRVYTEEDEALKRCRAKVTMRKYLHREQKRAQLAKLSKILGHMNKKEVMYEQNPAEACVNRHPPGAMAPENTTQYLMSNVYEDMKTDTVQAAPVSNETSAHLYGESLSPSSVYTALDSGYESCLAFQQSDFEEVFELCW